MAKRVNQYERAFRVWEILTKRVRDEADPKITYGDLGQEVGIHHRVVQYPLGLIQDFCIESGLPPLTVLVVSKTRHKPGAGFLGQGTKDEIERVQNQDWREIENPFKFAQEGQTLDEFIDNYVAHPRQTSIALAKQRGYAQTKFAVALRKIYQEKCAFCGLNFPEINQAAHIIPWQEASDELAFSLENGLLLCANHHRLFDEDYFYLEKIDGKIWLRANFDIDPSYEAVDLALTADICDKKICTDIPESCLPSDEVLEQRWGEELEEA